MQLPGSAITVFSNAALQSAAAVMNDPVTYVWWFGGSALLGVGGPLLPDAAEAVTDFTADPEVISNTVDFISGFDPNPAAPFGATFGAFAGWVESGGADDFVDALLNTGNQMLNYVQPVAQQQGPTSP
jgi:hypothetical protein